MDNPVKENLKKLMEADGKISEGELSRRTGIPQTTIHRILSGQIKESKPSTLKPIAAYFKLSLAQLQGEEAIAPSSNSSSIQTSTPAKLIPLITWELATIWKKRFKNYKHQSSDGWVATNKQVGASAYGLIIQGNSMSSTHGPSFEDGCEIVVDPERTPKHGDFVVVKQSDKPNAILRQLSIEGGSLDLLPLNPRYSVTYLDSLDDICGVVCQLLANF
jgi:SOS-response transcriptional repressor LexA